MTEQYEILCDEFDEKYNRTFDNKADALAYRHQMGEKFFAEENDPEEGCVLKDFIDLIYIKKYICGTLAELTALKPNGVVYMAECGNYSVKRKWWNSGKYICPTKADLDDVL